jgi:hypothetical protein
VPCTAFVPVKGFMEPIVMGSADRDGTDVPAINAAAKKDNPKANKIVLFICNLPFLGLNITKTGLLYLLKFLFITSFQTTGPVEYDIGNNRDKFQKAVAR